MSDYKPINIFLASDSTVQAYGPEHAPQAGWGMFIGNYFTDDVQILNHAIGGRSSRTFVEEGRLDAILNEIQANDYLLIQMGHNDSTKSKPERYTEPYTTYKQYLKKYVEDARQHDAVPILITPVARLHYEDGDFLNDFPDYCKAMKQVAEKEKVLLIDLMAASLDYFTSVGYDEVFTYFMVSSNDTDHTHFTEKGSDAMAKVLASEVKKLDLDISKFVCRNDCGQVEERGV
ncbi:MAG TPA: rhamnogalacturonan acetylesterase [Bacillales bacterium]|nr:rhamnogalacturonan acetylesterase [Bacillales bacterium]